MSERDKNKPTRRELGVEIYDVLHNRLGQETDPDEYLDHVMELREQDGELLKDHNRSLKYAWRWATAKAVSLYKEGLAKGETEKMSEEQKQAIFIAEKVALSKKGDHEPLRDYVISQGVATIADATIRGQESSAKGVSSSERMEYVDMEDRGYLLVDIGKGIVVTSR